LFQFHIEGPLGSQLLGGQKCKGHLHIATRQHQGLQELPRWRQVQQRTRQSIQQGQQTGYRDQLEEQGAVVV